MSRRTARSSDTRQRLLDAALEVFAKVGYRHATIQRICQRAGANIAAVHYHFGSKQRLYTAVFEYAERRMPAEPPSAGSATRSPAEQLRAHVTSFLRRLLDAGEPAWMARLLGHELIDPTPALDRLVRRRMRATHAEISRIVRALSPAAPPDAVRLTTLSIVAQCVFYRNSAAVVSRLYPDLQPARDVERIADHVTRFSLAAIGGLASPRKESRR